MSTLSLALVRFRHGAISAGVGCVRAVTDTQLRHAFWKSALVIGIVSLVLMIVIHSLLMPVEWIAKWFLPPLGVYEAVHNVRYALSGCVPFVIVAGCRLFAVQMFEKAFFSGLHVRNPKLSKRVKAVKPVYWDWEYVKHMLRQVWQQALFGILVFAVSPLVGALIPLAKFAYRIRHMDAMYYIPILLAFCFPLTQPMAVQAVRVWINAREITRELYDPIIARLKELQAGGATGPDSAWHHKTSSAAQMGFSLVLGSLVQLPFVGALAWFPAFVAAGLCAPELVNLNAFHEL